MSVPVSFKISDEEVRKIVMDMPTKSCGLDPLPTWFMKRCIDHVLPLLTKIINYSVRAGHVPDCIKVAHCYVHLIYYKPVKFVVC